MRLDQIDFPPVSDGEYAKEIGSNADFWIPGRGRRISIWKRNGGEFYSLFIYDHCMTRLAGYHVLEPLTAQCLLHYYCNGGNDEASDPQANT